MAGRTPPRKCADCHRPFTGDRRDRKCTSCHFTGRPWKEAKATTVDFGFALLGKHQTLAVENARQGRADTYTKAAA